MIAPWYWCHGVLMCAALLGCSSAVLPDPQPRHVPASERIASTSRRRAKHTDIPTFAEVFPAGIPQLCRLDTQPLGNFLESPTHEQCPCEVRDPDPPGMVSTRISCGKSLESFESRAYLEINFGPRQITIRRGESVTFRLSVGNPQDIDIPLILTDIPGRQVFIEQWPDNNYCDYGSNGGPWEYAVAIKPGARLWYEYTWDATHVLWPTSTGQCVRERRPLPVGRYVVFWRSPAVFGKGPMGWYIDLTVVP